MKWDLEQGPLGGDRGWLPSQTASPDSGNSNDQSIPGWLACKAFRALHPFLHLGKLRSSKVDQKCFRLTWARRTLVLGPSLGEQCFSNYLIAKNQFAF